MIPWATGRTWPPNAHRARHRTPSPGGQQRGRRDSRRMARRETRRLPFRRNRLDADGIPGPTPRSKPWRRLPVKPLLAPITAGNASGLTTAAALAGVGIAAVAGLTCRRGSARRRSVAPRVMGWGRSLVRRPLERTGWVGNGHHRTERSLAAQALPCCAPGLPDDSPHVNPMGRIVLGHPLGASGADPHHRGRQLHHTGGRYACVPCIGVDRNCDDSETHLTRHGN